MLIVNLGSVWGGQEIYSFNLANALVRAFILLLVC